MSLATATTPSPEQTVTEAVWKQNGCKHGHGSRAARRGLRAAMRGKYVLRGRARHFVRCVVSAHLSEAQKRRYRRYRAWRRSYRGWWRVQAMRTPYHAALAGLRYCESTGRYHISGAHDGAYQWLPSSWMRGQRWVPMRYRTARAHLASVDHQDVVTGRFYFGGHSGEWACSN